MNYQNYQRQDTPPPSPHPVWRGIGCALMVIIPIFSFVLSQELLPTLLAASGSRLPPELASVIDIPPRNWGLTDKVFFSIENGGAVLGMTALVSLLLFAVLAIVNAIKRY